MLRKFVVYLAQTTRARMNGNGDSGKKWHWPPECCVPICLLYGKQTLSRVSNGMAL
jgi:hypothetical protein